MWDTRIESTILKIGRDAIGLKIMHIDVARRNSKIYEILMILGIALGPVSGVLSTIGSALDPETDALIPIVSSVFGFMSGILIALVKFGGYDKVSSANKSAAAKYTSLESNVRRQLILYRDKRTDANKYLEWISKSYEELVMASPLIPQSVQEDYAKYAVEKGWEAPDRMNDTIEINTEYRTQKLRELSDKTSIVVKELMASESLSPSNIVIIVEEPDLKGTNVIARSKTLSSYPDMNKYSNGQMDYEMSRMIEL
jgi:hypothetical protein